MAAGLRRGGRGIAYAVGIPEFRLGTQSWTSFPDWLGTFYPPRLGAADALSFYSQVFDTVEVNTTFHALPTESTVRNWYRKTPEDFTFALKFPREVTHELRLEWPAAEPLTSELLRLAAVLEDKRGPLLLQLPPSFDRSPVNRRALATFLQTIPTEQIRLAVELRHPAWADASIERGFADRNIACASSRVTRRTPARCCFPPTSCTPAGIAPACRFNGYAEIQYDRSDALDWWATVFTTPPARVKTAYGYMADEFAGHAPTSLRMLCDRLGLPSIDPKSRWPQPALF